ncbi:MAG TPA: hypothetical protein VFD58_00380 [Blastocatellia bacterium]|nr:hypothetical protein [Blastocatellia bacterium]
MTAKTPTGLYDNFRAAYDASDNEQAREQGRIFLDVLNVIEWCRRM